MSQSAPDTLASNPPSELLRAFNAWYLERFGIVPHVGTGGGCFDRYTGFAAGYRARDAALPGGAPSERAGFEAWAAEEWKDRTIPDNAWLGWKARAERALPTALQFDGTTKSAGAICAWANSFAWLDDEPNASYITVDGCDVTDDLLVACGDDNAPVSKGDWVVRDGEGFAILRPVIPSTAPAMVLRERMATEARAIAGGQALGPLLDAVEAYADALVAQAAGQRQAF